MRKPTFNIYLYCFSLLEIVSINILQLKSSLAVSTSVKWDLNLWQDLSKEWLFPKRILSWRKSLLPYSSSSSSPLASSRLKCPLEDLLQFIHLILNEDLRF